jgi:tetratricopeptide (TPR) repeat protein
MNEAVDLEITLKPPTPDAPVDAIASIELRCEQLGAASPVSSPVDWLRAPSGLASLITPDERSDLQWYLETYWQWPYEGFAIRARQIEQQLPEIGKRLYRAVLTASPDATQVLTQWLLQAAMAGYQGRISIFSDMPAALSLPWELLHDQQGFLALRTHAPISITRRLRLGQVGALLTRFEPPLRILLVTARPERTGFVDPRTIARPLLDAVQPQIERGEIAVEFLRPPTLSALRMRLSKEPKVHILHFDGHGAFSEADTFGDTNSLRGGTTGRLAFEDDEGGLALVEADALAQVLQASGVKLAVLTACQSALGSADDLFSSIAARLIKSGMDAVIAMSASVLVVSASRYAKAFYQALSDPVSGGMLVPTAHERARQALHDDPRRHVHQRSHDESGVPVRLQDWWLPHIYQQRPLALRPDRPADGRGRQPPPLHTGLTPAPRYGFTGRAYELMLVERALQRGKLVVIYGFGGIGKTALASEAGDWLTRTGLYQETLLVSLEQGGGAAWLLGELGRHLDIYDGDYNPNNPVSALARLRAVMPGQPTLLIVDSVETVLPGGEAPLGTAERDQLWSLLLALREASAGVILTTRNTEFGDSRLGPGRDVALLQLEGLAAGDAYALATQLLIDLGIDRRRARYSELHKLLELLGHHPLAIQLVLPSLRDPALSLLNILNDFAKLLPRFADSAAAGRHGSLQASLEYALRSLSDVQRDLLSRLALFEGGAHENLLTWIANISDDQWTPLRSALERAGLLIVKPSHDDIPSPFLQFHPVLIPYLQSSFQPDQQKLLTRYIKQRLLDWAVTRSNNESTPMPRFEIRAGYLLEHPEEEDLLLAYVQGTLLHNKDFLDSTPDLLMRYITRYFKLADDLYHARNHLAYAVRVMAKHELPNLRRACALLMDVGIQADAVDMGDYLATILNFFGLEHERAELLERVKQIRKKSDHKMLTTKSKDRSEIMPVEASWIEDILKAGDPEEALVRCRSLLAELETLPEDVPDGPNSLAHAGVLGLLARCLIATEDRAQAERALRQALQIVDILLATQPEDHFILASRCGWLFDLGGLLADRWRYAEAQEAYEESFKVAQQLGHIVQQGAIYGQLGTIATDQGDYAEAQRCFVAALQIFRSLADPENEALTLSHLGSLMRHIESSAEAEQYLRQGLEIWERLGNVAFIAQNCMILGELAATAQRHEEACGWYQRALELDALPTPRQVATTSANLALALLTSAAPTGEQLAEARQRAEQAFAIYDDAEDREEMIKALRLLRRIAKRQGQPEAEEEYRRSERELFAHSDDNRRTVDENFGGLVVALALSCKVAEFRTHVEQFWAQLSAAGDSGLSTPEDIESSDPELSFTNIASAIRRIWAGEMDWDTLSEDLDHWESLTVLRILETLEDSADAPHVQSPQNLQFLIYFGVQNPAEVWNALLSGKFDTVEAEAEEQEEALHSIPMVIFDALRRGDRMAFDQLFARLSRQQQQALLTKLEALFPEEDEALDTVASGLPEWIKGLLQHIVLVALGNDTQRPQVERNLQQLGAEGDLFRLAVQRIWAGERIFALLVIGLNPRDTVLVQIVLKMLQNIERRR